MKKSLIVGILMGMGLLGVMAVDLTENPLVEVGHFQDLVTKSTPVVDVRAFGASGDGETDDTDAIQAAIDAAPYGSTVFFPPGTYVLGAPLEISARGIKITGHRAILKPLDDTLETLIDIMATGLSMQICIDGLLFSGYPVTGSHTGALIRAQDGALLDSVIQNCWFGMANANLAAIHARAFYSTITHCVFEFGGTGFLSDDDVTTYTGSLVMSDCQFYEMTGPVVSFTDPGGGNRHGTVLLSNIYIGYQASATGQALMFDTVTDVTLSNVVLNWAEIGVNPVNANGLYVTDVNHVTLSNVQLIGDVNHATSSVSRFNYGIVIGGDCNNVSLTNVLVRNARYGMYVAGNNHVRVTNSQFEGGYYDGILIGADAEGSFVMGDCLIQNYRQYLFDARTGNAMDIRVHNSRLYNGAYGRDSGISASRFAGTGRIEVANSWIGKTLAISDMSTCVTRSATDLWLFNNTFVGGVTAYSGSTGYVNTFREPISITNGSASAGYIDLYPDSDLGDTTAFVRESIAIVDLSNAQIKDLADTAVTLVAAPGSGKWLEFCGASLWLDYGTNALTEADSPDDLRVAYTNDAGAAASADIVASGFITATADTGAFAIPVSVAGTAAASLVNKALVLVNTGVDYTGNAANDTVLRVIVRYRVHSGLGL